MKLDFFVVLFQSLVALILTEFEPYVLLVTLGTFKVNFIGTPCVVPVLIFKKFEII